MKKNAVRQTSKSPTFCLRSVGLSPVSFFPQAQSTFSTQVTDLTFLAFLTFPFERRGIVTANPLSNLPIRLSRSRSRLFRRKYLIFPLFSVTCARSRTSASLLRSQNLFSAPETNGQINGQILTDSFNDVFRAFIYQPKTYRILQIILCLKVTANVSGLSSVPVVCDLCITPRIQIRIDTL